MQEVRQNKKRETDADSDASAVVEEDVTTQRRSVEEEQQTRCSHAHLKINKKGLDQGSIT